MLGLFQIYLDCNICLTLISFWLSSCMPPNRSTKAGSMPLSLRPGCAIWWLYILAGSSRCANGLLRALLDLCK